MGTEILMSVFTYSYALNACLYDNNVVENDASCECVAVNAGHIPLCFSFNATDT